MKKNYSLILLTLFCLITHNLTAQCNLYLSSSASTVCSGDNVTLTANVSNTNTSLTTTLAAGNNHRGNMFDIYATNTVTITAFDAHPVGNTTIEIYYRASPYLGFETSSAGWTLIGSAAVTAQTTGTPTPVPVAINITIPAGQTYSFYVTSTNTAVSLNYTNGTTEGATFASDANIIFREGVGMEYPFTNGTTSVFRPRIWNGVIHYAPATSGIPTYLWNTSETTQSINPTITSTTAHTVQVDITGCPTMYDTILTTVSTPPVSAGMDETICTDSSVTLSGSGATTYAWNNGVNDGVAFTPTSTSDYIVTGTDSIGCTATDTVTVTLIDKPTAGFISTSSGATIDFTNTSTDGLSYEWNFGDGSPLSNDQDPTHTYTSSGSYSVTLIATNNCGADTIIQSINITTTGISNNEKAKILIAPNPNKGIFNLTLTNYNSSSMKVEIRDTQGKVIYVSVENNINGKYQKQIDISSIAKGVYLLRVYTDNEVINNKFILN